MMSQSFYFDYFDSVGKYPNAGIRKYIDELIDSCKESGLHNEIKFRVNRTQHQKKNSECGVYSINYILNVLNDVPFDKIVNNVMDDELTLSTRELHFRPNE